MFYDVYIGLCNSIGKKPSTVAEELGINKSNVSNWKNSGYTPRGEALQRIAEYFGVSTDFLLGNEKKPTVNNDDELTEYLEVLKNRSDIRMLFSLAKGATREDVEKAVRIIEALKNE